MFAPWPAIPNVAHDAKLEVSRGLLDKLNGLVGLYSLDFEVCLRPYDAGGLSGSPFIRRSGGN